MPSVRGGTIPASSFQPLVAPLVSKCLLLPRLLVLSLTLGAVSAQRLRKGCYDEYALSCDGSARVWDPSNTVPEEVCSQLSVEIFPDDDVMQDPSQHAEFLNTIPHDSDLCRQLQEGYSSCIFCDVGALAECDEIANWDICGNQPSLDEVLQNNEDYPLFQTKADVDRACAELEVYYDIIFLKDFEFGMPTTFGLCEVQKQIKHLCPGYCEGGCFDGPSGLPPTCDGYPAGSYVFDPDQVDWDVCDDIDYNILYYVGGLEDILNISLHADYLKAIPGNSTECDQARQAYSSCYWCATDRCFDEEYPVSCQPPEGQESQNLPADELDLADRVCSSLFNPLHVALEEGTRDFYNESLHQDHMYFGSNNSFCALAQQYYSQCFFCHQVEYDENFCMIGEWCQTTTAIPSDYVLEEIFADLNITASGKSCEQVYQEWEDRWYNPYTLTGCYRDIFLHRQCPQVFCQFEAENTLNENYLGTTNDSQKKALLWMSRVSALLSFLGASYIMAHIGLDQAKRGDVYYQLVFGMAIFDLVTALAWSFATTPVDETKAGHILGAKGTEATCTAQAFFVQLGFTSIFYSVSLATYYVLVVVYSWKDFQLKTLRKYFHGLPLLMGLGLSFAGLPAYHWIEYGCHLNSLQFGGELWAILALFVVPLSLAILYITASMMFIFLSVQKKTNRSLRWAMTSGNQESMIRQVFWQSTFYALAFYITWPIMFSVYLGSVDFDGPLGLSLTVAFVAPLQGFSNFLVFIRIPFTAQVRRRFTDISGAFMNWTRHLSSTVEDSRALDRTENGSRGNWDPSALLARTQAESNAVPDSQAMPRHGSVAIAAKLTSADSGKDSEEKKEDSVDCESS